MLILLRTLLTFNATSLLLVIYFVKSVSFDADSPNPWGYALPVSLVLVPLLLTGVSVKLAGRLTADNFPVGSVTSLSHASNVFLPSYLGYFFVALSVPNWPTLIFVYAILSVFTYFSQALYFNPLFLLYGYRFYSIRTIDGLDAFLISKADWRTPAQVYVKFAHRINGFTFIHGKA